MKCEIEMQADTAVCRTHGKKLVCPSANAASGNRAMRRKFSKKKRTEWARLGGRLGGRPKTKKGGSNVRKRREDREVKIAA